MAAQQGNLHSPLARCATIPKAAKDSAQGEHRSSVGPRWICSQAGIARNVCFYNVSEGLSIKPARNSSGPQAMSRAPWNCIAAQQADLHSPLVFQWFLAFAFAGQQDPRSAPGAAPDAEGFAVKQDLLETFDFTRFSDDFLLNMTGSGSLQQASLWRMAWKYTDFQGFPAFHPRARRCGREACSLQ